MSIRVAIEYAGTRRALVIPEASEREEIISMCLMLFNISGDYQDFQLIIQDLDCPVQTAKELLNNEILLLERLLEIRDSKYKEDPMSDPFEEHIPTDFTYSNPDDSNSPIHESTSQDSEESEDNTHSEDGSEIDIEELYQLDIKDREELDTKVKNWAASNKMMVSFKGPERVNIRLGNKVSTLFCKRKQKGCKFYLEFHTNSESKKYELKKYYNSHNHPLEDYDSSQQMTKKVLEKIALLKATGADTRVITGLINQEFETNFHWRSVYYQMRKLTDRIYGRMSEDASKLFSLFEKDSSVRKSYYEVEKDEENRLISCCFMSPRMKTLLEFFNDVIVIDTTHKTNRFNMPLMDVIIINNMGQSCTTFFALLKNQTYEAYRWALCCLKSRMKKNPLVIFTDDEEALTKGKLILQTFSNVIYSNQRYFSN